MFSCLEWVLIEDSTKAAKAYKQVLLATHAGERPLDMRMDVRHSEEDRERALLSIYKGHNNWAGPLQCTLEG